MFPLFLTAALLGATPEDAKLATLYDQILAEELRRHPVDATRTGLHDYDGLMDDLRPIARAEDLQRAKAQIQTIRTTIDPTRLSRSAQIDREIWLHALEFSLWRAENERPFETDPRIWGEYFSDSVFWLLTQSTLPRERNVQNAASRIAFVPQVIAAAKESLTNPPRILTEIAIQRAKAAQAFYEKEIFPLAAETPATSALTEPSRRAAAALGEYARWLESELLPRSNGEWRVGKAKFAAKLHWELQSGLTADELLAEAEREAVRVEQELWVIARQMWSSLFPGVVIPPDDAVGRRDGIRRVLDQLGQDHGTPEGLLTDTRATVQTIQQFITDRKILTLPKPDRCNIELMPTFQRGYSVAYLNPAPPLDPQAKSFYAVAPPPEEWPAARQEAFFREYNRAMLQILTIHEAYPGHYVQLEYSNRHPSKIRKILSSGVFAEGWAVYTEQMMLDQGYGAGDLSLRMHQLKFYLRAVLNAVLDYKMHCTDYSDEEAVRLLMERGFQTEGEAVGKVKRAKQSSGQLSTYFAGRTAFYRLRQSVQRSRGDRFDLGAYHEEVLSHGTLPVKYLPELVK